MKKPKAEQINLPYASTVASYHGDQGEGPRNSFLGALFRRGGMGGATAANRAITGNGAGMLQ